MMPTSIRRLPLDTECVPDQKATAPFKAVQDFRQTLRLPKLGRIAAWRQSRRALFPITLIKLRIRVSDVVPEVPRVPKGMQFAGFLLLVALGFGRAFCIAVDAGGASDDGV